MLSSLGAVQPANSSGPPSPSTDPKVTTTHFQQSGRGFATSGEGVGASMQRGKEESAHDLDQPMPTASTAAPNAGELAAIKSAIQLGDVAAVKAVIAGVQDINAAEPNGETLLSLAAESGNLEIVKALREGGARIGAEAQSVAAGRYLRSASLSGDAGKVAAWIAAGVEVDSPNKNGASPLMIAAQNGKLEVVRLLMAANANVECRNRKDRTALELAALKGHLSVVRVLRPITRLERSQADAHLPALKRAIDTDNLKVAVALIHAGLDLGALYREEIQANLALEYIQGAWGGFSAIVRSLGATLQQHYNGGDDALIWQGFVNQSMIIAAKLGKTGLTEALRLTGGSIPAEAAFHAERALRDAARDGNSESVKAWIAAGVNVNALNEDRVSALMYSSLLRSTDIPNLLINAGADLNLVDRDGDTALIYAAKSGNLQAASILCEHGADLNVPGHLNMRAFQWAIFCGHLSTANRLLEAGAQVSAQDMARAALRITSDAPANAASDDARIMLAATRATALGLHFLADELLANLSLRHVEQGQVLHTI